MPPTAAAQPSATVAVPAGTAGLRTFLTVWLGQTVSQVGSGLTAFALGIWVFQRTGSVAQYAMILVFAVLPGIALAPVAGALVDRWDRRRTMMAADTAAALGTLGVAALVAGGRLEVWHVYLAVGWSAVCGTFQRPAWLASVSLIVPREQLGRTAGLMQLGQGAAQVLAPVLGGVLLVTVGLHGVILVDVATFLVGVTATWMVMIPRPAARPSGKATLFHDAAEGWRYLVSRPALLWLALFFGAVNLSIGFLQALLAPMALSFAPADRFGAMLSAGTAGLVAGGMAMSAWGGPARRVRGVALGGALLGAGLLAVGARPATLLVSAALFVFFLGVPIANACYQALVQGAVAPEVQGRVFATVKMISWSAAPVAYLAAAPLVAHVFGPLRAGLALPAHPGGGPALLLSSVGVLLLAATAVLHLSPSLHRWEARLGLASKAG